jgi:NAD(P)-dependent dehydrogenase (short-subunit alcohol dehydrogenase family)
VLVHAAEQRPSSAALSGQSLSAVRDALQANAHFPVLLTRLLLPSMLHRTGAPKLGPREFIFGDFRSRSKVDSRINSAAKRSDVIADEGTAERGHGGCRVLFVSSINPTAPSPMTSIFSASKAMVSTFAQVGVTLFVRRALSWRL